MYRPLSSRLPDGGRTTGHREEREGRRENQHHRRLIQKRTPGTSVQPVRPVAG